MADGRGSGPNTWEEWQRVADAARALLVIEAVRVPSPGAVEIDRGACEDVLARARERGVAPQGVGALRR